MIFISVQWNLDTVYNERPRNWRNLFAVTRFRFIKVGSFLLFSGVKKIVC